MVGGKVVSWHKNHQRYTQFKRILSLAMMMSGREYSVYQLAKIKKVSTKTIRRDLQAMEEVGIPLYNEKIFDDGRKGTAFASVMTWRVDRHWMKRFL